MNTTNKKAVAEKLVKDILGANGNEIDKDLNPTNKTAVEEWEDRFEQSKIMDEVTLDSLNPTQRKFFFSELQIVKKIASNYFTKALNQASQQRERGGVEKERKENWIEANNLLRSLNSVVQREGKETDWEPLKKKCKNELGRQHKLLKPIRLKAIQQPEPLVGKPTLSAREQIEKDREEKELQKDYNQRNH